MNFIINILKKVKEEVLNMNENKININWDIKINVNPLISSYKIGKS